MGNGNQHIDRLLPRHSSEVALDLTWDVRTERSGMLKTRREETADEAVIRDISLEGALIEVSGSRTPEVGDRVAVRFRDIPGLAVVRHCRRDDDTLSVGVRFKADAEFQGAIADAVGELRGHSAELDAAWRRRN